MACMSETYIHMGSVSKPHGVQGEIALAWYGVSPFSRSLPYYLQSGNATPEPITIEEARMHNGRLLVRIAGVVNREQAAELRGKKILTLRASLPPPGKNEAYVSDLVGATVFLQDGTAIGRFSHVVLGTDVWSITGDDGREILFPAQPDFIVALDSDTKRIVIAPPEGLLDLYNTP